MKKKIYIDGAPVGDNETPYIVAEISANHNGSIDNALELMTRAKAAGASAVKIQTYTADTITLKSSSDEFLIKGGLWDGRSLYDLYTEAHTPWEWHPALFEHAKNVGITIFSSPFDHSAIDFLESLNAPAYKIASFEAVDIPLIKYAARTGKPLIISTGMCSFEERRSAYEAAVESGCEAPIMLHCVSGYPASLEDYNLSTMADMRRHLDCLVGVSDHSLTNTVATTATALGACFIEKHFTLDRGAGGPDDSFSLEPPELDHLVAEVHSTFKAVGNVDYRVKASEAANIQFRRSIYVVKPIRRGELLTSKNIRSVRPGYGLPPSSYEDVVGRKAMKDLNENEPLTYGCVDWSN